MSNEIGREMWVQCLIMQRLNLELSPRPCRSATDKLIYGNAPSAVSITLGGSWSTIYNLSLTKVNALLSASYQLFHPTYSNEAVIRTKQRNGTGDSSSQVPVVQFSHFSVKEYLTSARLAASSQDVSRYHIALNPAHTILAQACMSVLLQLGDHDKRGEDEARGQRPRGKCAQ